MHRYRIIYTIIGHHAVQSSDPIPAASAWLACASFGMWVSSNNIPLNGIRSVQREATSWTAVFTDEDEDEIELTH